MFVVDYELIIRTLTHLSACESREQTQNKRKTEWHKSDPNKAMILLNMCRQKETRNTRVIYVHKCKCICSTCACVCVCETYAKSKWQMSSTCHPRGAQIDCLPSLPDCLTNPMPGALCFLLLPALVTLHFRCTLCSTWVMAKPTNDRCWHWRWKLATDTTSTPLSVSPHGKLAGKWKSFVSHSVS